jgi:hypothetical protein
MEQFSLGRTGSDDPALIRGGPEMSVDPPGPHRDQAPRPPLDEGDGLDTLDLAPGEVAELLGQVRWEAARERTARGGPGPGPDRPRPVDEMGRPTVGPSTESRTRPARDQVQAGARSTFESS